MSANFTTFRQLLLWFLVAANEEFRDIGSKQSVDFEDLSEGRRMSR